MERVVYLLGAGFSAPLGLPVVSNFFAKSKDMVAVDVEKFGHFEEVFKVVETLAICSTYYKTNIRNIEDVLSILEMGTYLKGKGFDASFKHYIKQVVEHYTPPITQPPATAAQTFANWTKGTLLHDGASLLFGGSGPWTRYGFLVASLLRLNLGVCLGPPPDASMSIIPSGNPGRAARYAVVTLNYDRVLERMYEFISQRLAPSHPSTRDDFGFVSQLDQDWSRTPLAKLHGSTNGEIVPPTWSKGVVQTVVPDWKLAYDALCGATQIRIIGYSLPTADAYVKYLLKAASTQNRLNLKRIDVMCLDGDGSVEQRFSEFITFDNYRFINCRVEAYLDLIQKHTKAGNGRVKFDGLEAAHQEFLESGA